VREYRLALLHLLREDAGDLITAMGLQETIADLELRLVDPEHRSAAGKLTKGILGALNTGDPMRVKADDFNRAAERYYRGGLRQRHMEEGVAILEEDFRDLDRSAEQGGALERAALHALGEQVDSAAFLSGVREDLLAERLDAWSLRRLINLTLLSVTRDQVAAEAQLQRRDIHADHAAPIHRAG